MHIRESGRGLNLELETMLNKFRIVTGPANHTGTAIFHYRGHAIHIDATDGADSSALRVFVAPAEYVVGVAEFEAPASLEAVVQAKQFIDDKLANAIGEPWEERRYRVVDKDRENVTDDVDRLRMPLPPRC